MDVHSCTLLSIQVVGYMNLVGSKVAICYLASWLLCLTVSWIVYVLSLELCCHFCLQYLIVAVFSWEFLLVIH